MPGDLGTCYFAEQPEGCFLEAFKNFSTGVPIAELQMRRLARIEIPQPLSIADCTAEGARAWGVTAEIHSSPDYAQTQAWAAALAHSGFDGICYFLRHDPAQRLIGIALFGPAGSPSGYPTPDSGPIGRDLTERIKDRFGTDILK